MSSPSSPDEAATPPPASLAIHLDLVGGISGDMFVAAMVDALPALATPVLAELAALQPAGAPGPAFREAANGGLRARRFGVSLEANRAGCRAVAAGATPATARAAGAHEHAGTPYTLLRQRLVDAPLRTSTREHALALLALLADAEARVHGISVDDVHFHELADWDSLMDVVAAGCIAAELDGAHWSASALPLGGGSVRTAHGLLPIPAPATGALLTGYPWHDDGVAGERVTPTGAAILRHLVPSGECGARRDGGRLVGIGCGAGTRTLPGIPNIVRALVFERAFASDADVVAVLEFDVDDMTGEEIAVAAERLRAGARRDRRVGRHAARQEGAAARRFPPAGAAAARSMRSRGPASPRHRRSGCACARSTGASCGAPKSPRPSTATPVQVKVAERPGGVRTAKAAQDDVAFDVRAGPAPAGARNCRATRAQGYRRMSPRAHRIRGRPGDA